MQISVESLGGLQKRLTIEVPSDEIEQEVTSKLKSLVAQVKVDGFRRGKVPFKVIQQRYDVQVRQEVLESVIQKSYFQALNQEKLRPAGGPDIKPGENNKPGENFEFSATFEVYPEVNLNSCEGEDFEKITVEITENDINKLLEKLQVQRVTWNSVDRGAQEEDQVILNFEGKIEGEVFEGGKADNHALVLGSNTMIAGFEEQLTGLTVGDKKIIKVSFPDDYWKAELAAKPAEFDIEIIKVSEPVLPEINDAFAEELGVADGGIEKLKQDVRGNMEMELDQKLRSQLKDSVLGLLIKKNEIDLPKSLIEHEVNALKQQYKQNAPNLAENQLPLDEIEDQAKSRVSLGLLIAEVISKNDISANSDSCKARMDAILSNIASTYDDPETLISQYRNNKEAMQSIQSLALEDEVVDHLLSAMNVTEKSASFDEIMNPSEALVKS